MSWDGLNKNLLVSIYEVDDLGNSIGNGEVKAPISDANFEASFNWNSPFENSGPESKAPALMAMLQTGQLGGVVTALGIDTKDPTSSVSRLGAAAQSASNELKNRTGITKINSRQVFSGMPPVKLSMTLHFRAIKSPQAEVAVPIRQLLEWAFPKKLSTDSVLVNGINAISGFFSSEKNVDAKDLIFSMFPSETPAFVGVIYAGERYAPMVIESISKPIDGPMDGKGHILHKQVQITLATLTALDRDDVRKIYRGRK